MKRIDFYYFSGTGNTLLVVKEMAAVFQERGATVALHRIEKSDPAKVDMGGTIGLAFPVAVQSTYPFVWEFVEGMPQSDGTGVFMADTLAQFSGGMVGPLKRKLEAKGYRALGAREIVMPSNFCVQKADPERDEIIRASGRQAAREYALSLLEGTAGWGRGPFFSPFLYALSRWSVPWKFLRRKFGRMKADETRCTKCQVCVKLCPVGNITMEDPSARPSTSLKACSGFRPQGISESAANKRMGLHYPRWADRCQVCLRCFSFCPAGAIRLPGKQYERYQAVSLSEITANNQ